MSEIIASILGLTVYGVANDYDGMIELVRYRLHELQTTNLEVDAVSGLHSGYTSKTTAPIPIKSMGKVSMGPLLQTLGLALIVVRDDEAFAKIEHRLAKRVRPHQPANGGSIRPKWLFKRKKAIEMGKRRFSLMTATELSRHQRKAGKASALARRRRAQIAAAQEIAV